MTDLVFRTGGDWDSTSLANGGVEVAADRLYVELRSGRDAHGDPIGGGIAQGADFQSFVQPADEPENLWDVFPGRLTMEFPDGRLILENTHPEVDLNYLHVWLGDQEVTRSVIDLVVDINGPEDVASAFVTIYKDRFLVRDEVITHTLL